MGVMDYVNNNILGVTEKALIEVIDLRDRKINEQGPVPENKDVNAAGNMAEIGDVTTYTDSAWVQQSIDDSNKLAWMEACKEAKKKNLPRPLPYVSPRRDFKDAKVKYFRVQFNPNTIRLSGHSGGLVKKTDYKRAGNGAIEYGPGKTYIDFSVSLFFDKVDPQDAFLEDKLQIASPVNAAKGVAKAVLTAAGKKSNSVQPEVEGFIAALRNQHTRTITFHWGDFNYTGMLRNVNAVYTMFNINGQPVRATVDLTMTCADSELAKNSVKTWNNLYKESFSNGSESFVQLSQQAKTLINI